MAVVPLQAPATGPLPMRNAPPTPRRVKKASMPHPVRVGIPAAAGGFVEGKVRTRLSRLRIWLHMPPPIWQPAARTVNRRMGVLVDTLKVPRKKAEPAFGFVSVFEAITLLASSRAYNVAVQEE